MTATPGLKLRSAYFIVPLSVLGAVGCGVRSAGDSSTDGSPQVADQVRGNLIQLSDNGAWSWFQDERAAIDPAAGKLVVGASANRFGVGGSARDGDIDATTFDLATGRPRTFTLHHHLVTRLGGDDHNAPALLVRPDGAYVAVYANHNRGSFSYYRIWEDGRWGPERRFDWSTMPGGTDSPTTYSNLFYLSAEDRVYNFARSDERSPNLMVSDTLGETWSYGGQLTESEARIGYVDGYFKYATNGVDRIDFIATEHHPRDFDTSIYHGYVEAGRSHATDGAVLDDDVADKSAPAVESFTPVFKAGTAVDGIEMTHAWPIDLQTYDNGTIAALFQARADGSVQDHRFFHARYDGREWSWEYLGKAGPGLYSGEQDYTGLGALDPDDPATIYLSTPIDPRDDAELGAHEIFEGTLGDDGWSWTPLTWSSTSDNLRPVVPAWNGEDRAVIWWRGIYTTAQKYDAAVVGVLSRPSERTGGTRFVDARVERGHVNAPAKASVPLAGAGTYDVWVSFWAKRYADWRIKAGLSRDGMRVFRQPGSQPVEERADEASIATTRPDGARLYRAYLGRVDVRANAKIDVFVDDCVRTRYDGVGYAPVDAE
jgi:BNR repeat-containing family member